MNQHEPTRFRGVVFDMDGLMFNTEELYDEVGSELLRRRGRVFTAEAKRAMMGRKAPDAFDQLRQVCDLSESTPTLMAESDQIMDQVLETTTRLRVMPGLLALLELLERQSIPKAVATSSRRAFAERMFHRFDLNGRFQFVLTGDDVVQGKPHPEIYLLAAQRLGVAPQSLLVLEDSYLGSQAAVACGAFTVAIPSQTPMENEFDHVHLVVDHLFAPELVRFFAE